MKGEALTHRRRDVKPNEVHKFCSNPMHMVRSPTCVYSYEIGNSGTWVILRGASLTASATLEVLAYVCPAVEKLRGPGAGSRAYTICRSWSTVVDFILTPSETRKLRVCRLVRHPVWFCSNCLLYGREHLRLRRPLHQWRWRQGCRLRSAGKAVCRGHRGHRQIRRPRCVESPCCIQEPLRCICIQPGSFCGRLLWRFCCLAVLWRFRRGPIPKCRYLWHSRCETYWCCADVTCSNALWFWQCRHALLHHVSTNRESVFLHEVGDSLHTGLHIALQTRIHVVNIVVTHSFGENLQSRQVYLLLRPYVWLYETLNDEHSSCQAHGDIHIASAPS